MEREGWKKAPPALNQLSLTLFSLLLLSSTQAKIEEPVKVVDDKIDTPVSDGRERERREMEDESAGPPRQAVPPFPPRPPQSRRAAAAAGHGRGSRQKALLARPPSHRQPFALFQKRAAGLYLISHPLSTPLPVLSPQRVELEEKLAVLKNKTLGLSDLKV